MPNITTLLDSLLNRITMYRLMLYFLMVLVALATILSALGRISFGAGAVLSSAVFLLVTCWAVNKVMARIFRVPANVESAYITALILALLITPVSSVAGFTFLFWASVIAMASKYLIAWRRKHIFNPAALAVVITAFALGQSAGWWVASPWLLLPVIVGGALIVRKIRRFDLVLCFFLAALASSLALGWQQGTALRTALQ